MTVVASEVEVGALSTYLLGYETYDSTKLGIGPLFIQNNGANDNDRWVGPNPIKVGRPMEASVPFPAIYPYAIPWSNTATSQIDWIFYVDNATAAATRRVAMYIYNRITGDFSYQGFITCNFPTTTSHTVRSFYADYFTHSMGTCYVTGSTAYFSGSYLDKVNVSAGSRIGFGSTNPSEITTWYEIASRNVYDITMTEAPGDLPGGTPYVIEQLHLVFGNTNATATNGGVFLVKGLRPEIFTAIGTSVPAGTTVDNIRASYWLKSAATITETAIGGMGLATATWEFSYGDDRVLWVNSGTTTSRLYKFNLRRTLTLTAGADTTAFVLASGTSAALTGTASQVDNGIIATTASGPGSGLECFYFTTTTRVYRTVALSTITSGSTSFLADSMVEIPPGGTATMAASSVMNSIDYSDQADKFFITLNATTTPFRMYLTSYQTTSAQFDRVWGTDVRQLHASTADSSTTPVISTTGLVFTLWSERGMLYIATVGASAAANILFALPVGSDWAMVNTSNQRVIFPSIPTPNADKFMRAYWSSKTFKGGTDPKYLGYSTEPVRLYYRTAGISDNTGGWTLMGDAGDLSSLSASTEIQYMAEFKVLGSTCIPSAICNVGVVYKDISTDNHFQLSLSKSSPTSKQFTWRYSTAFGGTVPALAVRIFDAVTNSQLVSDNTTAPTGTWERSTDGTSFSAWTNADRANETTYVRYTPASLADNITVRPVLTLA